MLFLLNLRPVFGNRNFSPTPLMILTETFSSRHFKTIVLFLAIFAFGFTAYGQEDGKKLFMDNCSSCHNPTDKKKTGPGLKDVRARWGKDDAKIAKWVKDPAGFVKTDAYAKKLVEEYSSAGLMTAQSVNDAQVKAILDYVDSYVEEVVVDPGTPGGPNPKGPEETSSLFIWVGLGIFFLILIAFLAPIRRSLQHAKKVKEGEVVAEEHASTNFWEETKHWIYSHKKVVFVLGFVVFIMLFLVSWDALMGVGVYEGYAPEQPIKFSHKLHAGDNKINCQYCHTGVEKSRHANIPSANVCMNCHKNISSGPQYGTTEIAKIYAALDYNPDKQTYGPNPKPIKWVRVHNLPDLAYFNHSQHVKVGGIECKQCHGAIDSMDVVKQNAPLTMGWCVDCHRTTEVKTDSNAYYTDLKAKFMATHPGENFTVDKMGGLECSKCHY